MIIFASVCTLISLIIYHVDIVRVEENRRRPEGYFTAQSWTYDDYREMAEHINKANYKKVGLFIPGLFEYPLWTMIPDVEYRNINVDNVSSKYEEVTFEPECIVYATFEEIPDTIKYGNKHYERTFYHINGNYYFGIYE